MHEHSVLRNLITKVTQVAVMHNSTKVTRVHVRLGALSHMDERHFCEHFEEAAAGSCAEGAEIVAIVDTDETSDYAQDVLLEKVDLLT